MLEKTSEKALKHFRNLYIQKDEMFIGNILEQSNAQKICRIQN